MHESWFINIHVTPFCQVCPDCLDFVKFCTQRFSNPTWGSKKSVSHQHRALGHRAEPVCARRNKSDAKQRERQEQRVTHSSLTFHTDGGWKWFSAQRRLLWFHSNISAYPHKILPKLCTAYSSTLTIFYDSVKSYYNKMYKRHVFAPATGSR